MSRGREVNAENVRAGDEIHDGHSWRLVESSVRDGEFQVMNCALGAQYVLRRELVRVKRTH